jgi:DNA-binding transcriptional LysR family regulator
MDKLKSMKVFARVAKAGSFVQGARDANISKAMATKHIMSLEYDLGTRLFNRTTRSVSLTEVGASYLERCQQVLQDVEEMEASVTHMQTEPRGVLKISTPPVIGAVHIAPALAEFIKLHPDLNVEMILRGGIGDLIDGGIDIAI